MLPKPLQVPVGRETLGRIMNVIGEPVDECGPIRAHPETISAPHPAILFSGAVRVVCGRTSILTCGLLGLADAKHHWGIHREAPPFVEQSTAQEILVTGIKARPAPSSYSRMLNSSFGACKLA